MSDYLPEEIMMRIFEKLPTKSLIKFTCLSKRWKYIILSDPVFAKTHFQIASQHQTQTRRFLFKSEYYPKHQPKLEYVDLEETVDNNDSCWVKKKAHPPFMNQSDDEIIGFFSCNGLVCVLFNGSINQKTRLYIWNPTTGCNKEFPCPNFIFETRSLGFGYVSATDDYKVIVSSEIHDQAEEKITQRLNILSLRAADTWKQIEVPCYMFEKNATLLHETLHWVSKPDEHDAHIIIAFDLYKEEFRSMPLPYTTIDELSTTVLGVSVGGCLCLMKINFLDYSAEFWIMRDYAVADSWARQFTLSNVNPIPTRLVLATETSVFLEKYYHSLIRISGDDENKVVMCVVKKFYGSLSAIECQESLLWLP